MKRFRKFLQVNDSVNIDIKDGDRVKVTRNGERFWCIVLRAYPIQSVLQVDNVVTEQPFKCGDEILLNNRFIEKMD